VLFLLPKEGNTKPVSEIYSGVKKKRKKTGMVDGVQNISPKKETCRICTMCECNWTPTLVACKPHNCIFQFLLSENVVLCYILMNVMFK